MTRAVLKLMWVGFLENTVRKCINEMSRHKLTAYGTDVLY